MPTYRCTVRADGAADTRRAEVARAVTLAHHEVTGAPPYFAQVLFEPVPDDAVFIGGAPLAHEHVFVHGLIRDGRSAVDRRALTERLVRDVARAAGVDPRFVWVYLTEHPARQMAEFGRVLPEAGEETAWTDELPEALRRFMEDRSP